MLSQSRKKLLKQFVNNLNIKKTDLELLDIALTHPSFNFEENAQGLPDYERLEFLGDSVLRLSMSQYLFDKYPDFDEGKLTKIRSYLVSDEFLSKIALDILLSDYLNIGPHEAKDGGKTKPSILACALEATFGAVFKSTGFDYVQKFIFALYEDKNVDINDIFYTYNSKEILQQYTQSTNKDLPVYNLVSETGKAHDKTYEVNVSYCGEVLGNGIAKTKKEAEKIAAYNAIIKLKLI